MSMIGQYKKTINAYRLKAGKVGAAELAKLAFNVAYYSYGQRVKKEFNVKTTKATEWYVGLQMNGGFFEIPFRC